MKELHTSLLGFHSTIGNHHLESKLKAGSYAEDNEVNSYGLTKRSNDQEVVLYRTDKGIAIDLKQYNQHIILSTINNGDILSPEVWGFIQDTVLQELEVSSAEVHQHDERVMIQGKPYAEKFVSHLHKLETEFDSDYIPEFGSAQTH